MTEEQIDEFRQMNGILARMAIAAGMLLAMFLGGGFWILRRILNL